jgi:hypothetical protein
MKSIIEYQEDFYANMRTRMMEGGIYGVFKYIAYMLAFAFSRLDKIERNLNT